MPDLHLSSYDSPPPRCMDQAPPTSPAVAAVGPALQPLASSYFAHGTGIPHLISYPPPHLLHHYLNVTACTDLHQTISTEDHRPTALPVPVVHFTFQILTTPIFSTPPTTANALRSRRRVRPRPTCYSSSLHTEATAFKLAGPPKLQPPPGQNRQLFDPRRDDPFRFTVITGGAGPVIKSTGPPSGGCIHAPATSASDAQSL